MVIQWWFNDDLMGYMMVYSLVVCYIAIEAMVIDIVDLPIQNADFP